MVSASYLSSSQEEGIKKNNVSIDKVIMNTGVEVWKVIEGAASDPTLSQPSVIERWDITLTNSVHTNWPLGDLEDAEYMAELARFSEPHFHQTDEIRYIKEGGCCIDVLFRDGQWVRLELTSSDAILIPAGLCHRIILGDNIFVKAAGYYRSRGLGDEYIPLYECEDNHPVKQLYQQTLMALNATHQRSV